MTFNPLDVRYPIGKYQTHPFSEKQKEDWLNDIRFLPDLLENALLNLDEAQLHTPYRVDGWTIHQLVHHVADSHLNAYCRFKLTLTETNPTIRTYDEKLWANLNDVKQVPVNISITLLHALHIRWYQCLVSITEMDWNRTFFHPVLQKEQTLWYLLGMYAWHGKHHVAHVVGLREKQNW